MTTSTLTSQSLDALQRSTDGFPPPPASTSFTASPIHYRRLVRWTGVGRLEKEVARKIEQTYRLPSEDLLIGLHGEKMPIAFFLCGTPLGITVQLGTWQRGEPGANLDGSASEQLSRGADMLESILAGIYPTVDLEPLDGPDTTPWEKAGLALGAPSARSFGWRLAHRPADSRYGGYELGSAYIGLARRDFHGNQYPYALD